MQNIRTTAAVTIVVTNGRLVGGGGRNRTTRHTTLSFIIDPFIFSNTVALIPLSNAEQVPSSGVTVLGWITFFQIFLNILQTVSKPIIPHNVCINQSS